MSAVPKISVLMSVYNGEQYLAQAIESVLGQTMPDFEFIIINDGSNDNTQHIINKFSDKRIITVQNRTNIGLTLSLNKGIQSAKAQYIARHDADDISLPERFQKLYEYMERNPHIVLLGSSCLLIDTQGNVLKTKKLSTGSKNLKQHLRRCSQFCHGSVIYRKQTVNKLHGYRPKAKYVEDYDLWCRMAKAYDIENLAEPLYQLRLHADSISIKNLFTQKRYERLISNLYAKESKDTMEELDDLTDQEIESRLTQLLPVNQNTINRIHRDKYYEWSEIMYNAKKYKSTMKQLKEAMHYDARDAAAWLLLTKCVIKLMFAKNSSS
ncbi:MAG: glycosyltransferase [Candidatus Omnitrophica bacterium]|nr:glycosyltransferase [Candidatus Omnitrophota bacterium]